MQQQQSLWKSVCVCVCELFGCVTLRVGGATSKFQEESAAPGRRPVAQSKVHEEEEGAAADRLHVRGNKHAE